MTEFDAPTGEAPAAAPAPTDAPAPAAPAEGAPPAEGGPTDFSKVFDAMTANTEAVSKLIQQQTPQAQPPEGYVNPFETPASGFQQPQQQPAPPQPAQQPQQAYDQGYGPDDFPDDFLAGDPNLGFPDTQMADIAQHPAVQQLMAQNQQLASQMQGLTQMFDNFSTREAAAEVVSMHPELADPQRAQAASLRAFEYAQQEGFDPQIARNPKFVGMVLALDQVMERQASQAPAPPPAGDNFEQPGGPGPSGTQDEATAMAERMRAVSQPAF